MLDYLINIDSQLLLFFNSYHTPFLDNFMMLFSGRFVWVPMYAVILLILFKKFKPATAALFVLGLVAAIALADQTCATFIRPAVQRLRPSNLENPLSEFVNIVDGYRGGSYGFPSCHAANSFALAAFLILVVRRRAFVCFILTWAVVNCYSRMYLGVHYPGDILVGGLIGASFGTMCYYGVCGVSRHLLKAKAEAHKGSVSLPGFELSIFRMGITSINILASDVMIAVGAISALLMMLATFL